MGERMVKTKGAEICTEAFGSQADPAILLIMGACASMVWWPEGLCARLAAGGRFVIRYDNRDTGRSTTWPPGQPDYSLDDMASDVTEILDAYGIAKAHLMGMSLGGMIAQIVALSNPERVLSLTLVSSSVFAPPNPELPAIDSNILAYHASAVTLNWADPAAVMDYMVNGWRLLSGSLRVFADATIRLIGEAEAARATSPMSMFNHSLLKGGESWYGKTGQIAVPTLVIHGSEDPVLPHPHGVALAAQIPGARLLTLEGAGHELHEDDWETIVAAVLEHTAGASGRIDPDRPDG